MEQSHKQTEELVGTFTCPICGHDQPHAHSDIQQKAYHEEQLRAGWPAVDGWNRTDVQTPTGAGWYLCRGIEVPQEQYGKAKDFWHPNEMESQLSWFKWVRTGGCNSHTSDEIGEVLYFDPNFGFMLRNLLGNAVRSGDESRRRVIACPKYWRELPPFKK